MGTLFSPIKPVPTSESTLFRKKTFKQEEEERKINMSEWVVLDISGITKTTKSDRVIKILKEAKIDACKVTEIYQNESRNKPCISMTVRRAHYEDENKSPDWPGSWIIEEDYSQTNPEVTLH